MIHFFIGTKAQFIKMAPVMVKMKKRGLPFRYIDSGQHADLTKALRKVFGLRDPDVYLASNTESISSIVSAVLWYIGCLLKSTLKRKWLRNNIFPGGGCCLIHGDTLSTLLGLQIARSAGLKVIHIEAGLRSFNIWNPFPEEIIRIYCMKKADLLFAPSDEAFSNLSKMHLDKKVIKTNGNTVIDAMRLMTNQKTSIEIPEGKFALAACHRLETITRKDRMEKVTKLLNRIAKDMPVLFVMHRPTKNYLNKFGLMKTLDTNIIKTNMLDYHEFIALQKEAQIVLTDGGSIQEECAYLGKPCLILRYKTERSDGLNKNTVLWKFDEHISKTFLQNAKNTPMADLDSFPSPSCEIIDYLIETNYIKEHGN